MNPQGPEPRSGNHRSMTEDKDLDAFNAALSTWLDDDQATGLPEAETMYHSASAYAAMQRAIHNANGPGHERCPVDNRDYDIVLQVVGRDGIATIQHLEPGAPPGCVLRALRHDPEVAILAVMGYVPHETAEPEPNEPVTTTPADAEPETKRPWWRRLLGH